MFAARCCAPAAVHRRGDNGSLMLSGVERNTFGRDVMSLKLKSRCGWSALSSRCAFRTRRTPVLAAAAKELQPAEVAPPVEEGQGGDEGLVGKQRFVVQRCRKVEGKIMVRMEKEEKDGRVKGRLVVGCDLDGDWVLHWGVIHYDGFGREWDQPPVEMWPPASVPIKDYALDTPLKKSSSASEGKILHEVGIDFDCSDSIATIHFVLKEKETGAWFHNGGRDFVVPLFGNEQEDSTTIDVTDGLSSISSSDVKPGKLHKDSEHENADGYYREYSLLKEERVTNFITASVVRSEDMKSNHLVLDTDIPGDVVVHWGVCRGESEGWKIPKMRPPKSKVFRNKAIQTFLQKKKNEAGSWGLFPLDKDVVGVPFVLKLEDYTYRNNMGNDFYIPITNEARQYQCDMAELQGLLNSSIEQVVDSATYTDEIINDIRTLITDIAAERNMKKTSKEAQENILEEIEKLAAEAYSIFRSSTPLFTEESISDVETKKPSIHISSATGTGYDIICQCFNWESNKSGRWYLDLSAKADELSKLGFTAIWLPPPTESVSPQGYMPSNLYNLNSSYGSVEDLKYTIRKFHDVGIKVIGDIVLNHRCAQYQNKYGIWNIFGGRLNWDDRAIVCDDPHFQGRGNKSSGEMFHAAPNIDHSQDFVRRDIKEWICWLRHEIGYDGWRLDFVRGFWGGYTKDYMEASEPYFAVGEYWDSLSYTYGQMDHNQDVHRQRIIDWINSTNGTSGAFDITTKGIMHTALENYEYWRLSDSRGKPPGVIGWWPSRAVTFIENHDTGSTQGHWRFPAGREMQGYAYILTHPGTPTVFFDHVYCHNQQEIAGLISLRKRANLHCRSKVKIVKAEKDVYAAEIDEKVAMKMGPGYYEPGGHRRWAVAAEGIEYKVWESQ